MVDILTPKQRSYCMSRIKSQGTSIEKIVFKELSKKGIIFKRNYAKLPGKPDIVFLERRVLVFLDGDFWHGFRFPLWKSRLSRHWKDKIQANRQRDLRNFRRLRRAGWRVVRIWEHQIKSDLILTISKIISALNK